MILNILNKIETYERGEVSSKEEATFFQELVDSGMAWHLQGHYGRKAAMLIEEGKVKNNGEGVNGIK